MRIKDHTIDVLKHGDYTELILKDGTFYTPALLYEKGMMACNLCGTLMPIEKKYCPQCKEWVICIHEDYLHDKNHIERIKGRIIVTPFPNLHEKLRPYRERFIRDWCMQLKYPIAIERYNRATYLYSKYKRVRNKD